VCALQESLALCGFGSARLDASPRFPACLGQAERIVGTVRGIPVAGVAIDSCQHNRSGHGTTQRSELCSSLAFKVCLQRGVAGAWTSQKKDPTKPTAIACREINSDTRYRAANIRYDEAESSQKPCSASILYTTSSSVLTSYSTWSPKALANASTARSFLGPSIRHSPA
jgi:hypothetical protein